MLRRLVGAWRRLIHGLARGGCERLGSIRVIAKSRSRRRAALIVPGAGVSRGIVM